MFNDETSVNTEVARLRGRARKGKHLKARAPFGKWATQTFIAALRHDGLTAPWVIPGAIDREAFNIYVETQLAPRSGQAMLLSSTISRSTKAPRPQRPFGHEGSGCSY